MSDPAALRAYANLPSEVPDALLARHVGIGLRELQRLTGLAAAPEGGADAWEEAVTVRALASVFPWLNTFALDGAAKVARLEGTLEARFLDASEVEARAEALMQRFAELLSEIAPDGVEDLNPGDPVDIGPITMIAI